MNRQYQMPNVKYQNCGFPKGRLPQFCIFIFAFCFSLILFVAGCESSSKSEIDTANEIENLRQENAELNNQIEQLGSENGQLRKQIRVLSGLPHDDLENLYKLQRINIGGYTNFYDKDKDGKKETLIVYIQPIDQDGDVIKVAGAVEVQLWDLNSPQANQALLAEWDVTPAQLRKLWFAALRTNYRLTFDVADKIDSIEEPLTVKVSFTDYLTGKVFNEQKVIKP